MSRVIRFRTAVQAALWEHEIVGQLSDGKWENDTQCDWRAWAGAKVEVGEPVGRTFRVRGRQRHALDDADLVKWVGARMRVYAVLSRAGYDQAEVGLFANLFDLEGDWEGVPEYEGDRWQEIRRNLGAYDVGLVRRQVENGLPFYTLKHLRADLKEMKAAMGVRL